jgi:hypothetical protein
MRLNISVPDALAAQVRERGMSVSAVCQAALREELNRLDEASRAGRVDQWTRHLLHISQHSRMTIGLAGRIQAVAGEMREAAGLPGFGWNDSVPDAEFGECSVHVEDCQGQETHQ